MKTAKKYILFAAAALLVLSACTSYDADVKKFGNVVYLDAAKTTDVHSAIIKKTLDETERVFSATLAYPSAEDVTISVSVDPSLAATYNARFGTKWPVLDAKYYSLSEDRVVIPAGKTVSENVKLQLSGLLGEGADETGALPLDETYLLPVTITHSSISVLSASSTVYYLVKRSSNITTAAQLTDNWIEFPTLDEYVPTSMAWNNLKAMTYEALIFIDDFATSTVTSDGKTNAVNISSVMGVESYLLLRIGDTNFERRQLQFDGSGSGSSFGKFPARDATKNLQKGRWYHIACTYDQTSRIVRVYVDGEIQSEGKEMGVTGPTDKNGINLAMRAFFDLWNKETNQAQKDKYAELGYDKMVDARQFFIGYSYDDYRPLNGKIAEARVWSVARTPDQIWDNMYEIQNPEQDPTLLGYWKFDEGQGNTIKDYSQYGNNGVAKYDLEWPDGIEILKINETEE